MSLCYLPFFMSFQCPQVFTLCCETFYFCWSNSHKHICEGPSHHVKQCGKLLGISFWHGIVSSCTWLFWCICTLNGKPVLMLVCNFLPFHTLVFHSTYKMFQEYLLWSAVASFPSLSMKGKPRRICHSLLWFECERWKEWARMRL